MIRDNRESNDSSVGQPRSASLGRFSHRPEIREHTKRTLASFQRRFNSDATVPPFAEHGVIDARESKISAMILSIR